MFDSVLTQENVPRSPLAGLGLSLALCGAIAAAAWFIPFGQGAHKEDPVEVLMFTSAPPPPPPPPPPAGSGATPSAEKPDTPKPKRKPKVPTEPKPVEQQAPEPDPAPSAPAEPGGVPGGVAGGVQGGVVGGTVGGVVGGTIGGTGTVPFGQGMTRPTLKSGNPPTYSREAIAARVEGKVIVRCTITVEGKVQDCKVIKGVPMLEEIALASLRASTYSPVTFQGKPVAVSYTFPFDFKLP